jgi:hypothetical protein
MEVYLDLDDWNKPNDTPEVYKALKELDHYFDGGFRVNLFVSSKLPIPDKRALQEMGDYLMHGTKHQNWEVPTYAEIYRWENAKRTKIYKAPYWQLTDELYERLIERKWRVMLNGEDKDEVRNGIRFNWNIKDNPSLNNHILIGHGHVQNVCDNGLLESMDRIKMLPRDTNFKFLRDLK